MSKAILVIDVDEKFLGKEISLIKFTDDYAIYCSEELKPLPKKYIKIAQIENGIVKNNEEIQFMRGWNDCIDEISGEESGKSNV